MELGSGQHVPPITSSPSDNASTLSDKDDHSEKLADAWKHKTRISTEKRMLIETKSVFFI